MEKALAKVLNSPDVRRLTVGLGETLYHEGEKVFTVYYLEEGVVKLYKYTLSGKKRIIFLATSGALIGLSDCESYWATAKVLTPTTCFSIPKSSFSSEKLGVIMKENLIAQVKLLVEKLTEANYVSVSGRLARIMLAVEEVQKRGTGMIPLSRRDLAELIGASTKTVTRNLIDWQSRNLIVKEKDGWRVINKEVLKRLSEPLGGNLRLGLIV
jgi:CRP/FNR family transcriptional regulator